jgi:RNA polymerase sigma factor (sigma-70 family)
MNMNLRASAAVSDEQLWHLSREGDRDAFSTIVERYQTLICSLAYSACGDLANSEDLAQETFLAAWRQLGELREPQRFRHWLCGIVRNLSASAVRRDVRRGSRPAPMEAATDVPSSVADPAAEAVTREEETLLWRALGNMPENYREPLVLFYREQQSVSEVASGLELSEEVVRQRLSRGRSMLREEMTALVESTLARTRPRSAFTLGVLVALPMISASTASAAATAKVVARATAVGAGKGILAKLGVSAFVGPVIGLVCAYLGTTLVASTSRSKGERDCILHYARWRIIPYCFILSVGLAAVLSLAGKLYEASAFWVVVGISVWTTALVGGIIAFCGQMDREVKRIRIETNTTDETYSGVLAARGKQLRSPKYFESRLRLLGLPLFAIAWGGYDSDKYRPRAVCAWLAAGDIAVSPFLALGGFAAAPIAIGAITIGVLSLSLFWGIAFGVLAVGSLAFGWWALGCAAAGVKCAVGFAAVARDYAVGMVASGAEAGTQAARDWLKNEWLADFGNVIVHQAHWWALLCVIVALGLRVWRTRQLRQVAS